MSSVNARKVKRAVRERLRRTPWSELSTTRRVMRVGNWLLLVSSGAMAVSAATASSDWEIRSNDPPPTAKKKTED